MGYGYLFKVDESTMAAHVGERAVRGAADEEAEAASTGQAQEQVNSAARPARGVAEGQTSEAGTAGAELAVDERSASLPGVYCSITAYAVKVVVTVL